MVWDLSPAGRGEIAAYPADLGPVMQTMSAPDGDRLYASSFSGVVSVLDSRTGKVTGTIRSQLVDWPVGIALSPDGRWLATTDRTERTSIRDSNTLKVRFEVPPGFYVKAFSPDGAQALVDGTGARSGSRSAYVGPPRVLDLESGRTVFKLNSGPIEGAEWSPDGSLLATASFDYTARVHDARSGELLAETSFNTYEATDVSFRPDGSQLAVSSSGVLILDVAAIRDGRTEVVATLPARSGTTNVQKVEFSPDGSELVTGSLSPEVAVWDASSWALKYAVRTSGPSAGMSLLPSGRELVAGFPAPLVYTLDVDRLIEIARDRLTRSFTTAECVRYLHLDECGRTNAVGNDES